MFDSLLRKIISLFNQPVQQHTNTRNARDMLGLCRTLPELPDDVSERATELSNRRERFFNDQLKNIQTLPPEAWRGIWYYKLMTLIDWMNTVDDRSRIWFMRFRFNDNPQFNPDGYAGCSCCQYDLTDGLVFGSFFETYETCGINRTLEQNCEGMYKNICEWMFSRGMLESKLDEISFPTSYEELELRMAVAGF